MRIGMIGLGRMGSNMTTRLVRGGHEVVAHDLDPDAVAAAAAEGAVAAASVEELVSALTPPRTVWLMLPAGAVTETMVASVASVLDDGDTIVDGGNSRWTDSQRRGADLADRGISFLDAGTSGGIWGLAEGYCIMIGGDADAVARLESVLTTLAPPDGWAHVGPVGAGHFTKMVHNGVEYGLMQSYAEGFALLEGSNYELDLGQIAELWRHGSVVRSWLLDLTAAALEDDPDLEQIGGYVADSGEGRWTVEAAVGAGVPVPTIASALFARFSSQRPDSYANRLLAALRNRFGGHAVQPRNER